MDTRTDWALDTVDRFIDAGRELVKQKALSEPKYSGALQNLIEVIEILLTANENMARWLNKFTQFDFRADDARVHFLNLVGEYNVAKSGRDLRQMKWPCSEITLIYNSHIRPDMDQMFVQTDVTPQQLDAAFSGLGDADGDMVEFIEETVVGGIDHFLKTAEPAIDRGDFDAAEQARLEFKVRARHLSERLERLGGGLADLLLRFAQLGGRRVRLSG